MKNSQTKPDPKGKAIISLILGIISIISGMGVIYIYIIGIDIIGGIHFPLIDLEIVLVFYFLIPLAGLFFGKTGLKSTKKSLAMIGIGLCLISLLVVLSFYFFAKMMAETM